MNLFNRLIFAVAIIIGHSVSLRGQTPLLVKMVNSCDLIVNAEIISTPDIIKRQSQKGFVNLELKIKNMYKGESHDKIIVVYADLTSDGRMFVDADQIISFGHSDIIFFLKSSHSIRTVFNYKLYTTELESNVVSALKTGAL